MILLMVTIEARKAHWAGNQGSSGWQPKSGSKSPVCDNELGYQCDTPGLHFIIKTIFPGVGIPIIKKLSNL